jgi:hypothetical protein
MGRSNKSSLTGAAVSLTRHLLADAVAEREAERQDCKCYSYVRHVPPSYGAIATYL